jgi:hypothetical protein
MKGQGQGRHGRHDGRSRGHEPCGVWLPAEQKFCEEPALSLRRCRRHYENLKRDSLFESLQSMDKERREKALDMLDAVQKQRESWTYENAQGEAELIAAAQEMENSDGAGQQNA